MGQGQRTASNGLSLSWRQPVRGGLVAAEVALALVLLVGGGLLVRSFALLSSQAPGFRADHLLTAQITLPSARYATSESRQQFWSEVQQRLAEVPGVSAAVMSTALPFSNWEWQTDFKVEGREDQPNDGAGIREVTPGYFEALGIPVLLGRTITVDDRPGAPAVVFVSDAFAKRFMSGLDPIGHRVKFSRTGEWLTIAGVVASTRHLSLSEDLRPEMYVPARQRDGQSMALIAIRTNGDPATFAQPLRAAIGRIDPKLPVQSVKTMTQLIAASVAERRFLMTLLTLFSGLAAMLAAIGVYGVMSFLVSQGRREIGIRLALGARPAQVQRRLLVLGLRLVLTGVAVGLGASLLVTKFLKSQLFGTRPNDPATIATVTTILIVAAAIACWIPARRTSRVDPTESLRQT